MTIRQRPPKTIHAGSTVLQHVESMEYHRTLSATEHTLPPVEQTPLMALRFTGKASSRLQLLVLSRLKDYGVLVLSQTPLEDGKNLVLLTATHKALEKEAELIHLVKPIRAGLVDRFTVQTRARFCDDSVPYRDQYGLFNASEWSLLMDRLLDSITVTADPTETTNLSSLLDTNYRQTTGRMILHDLTRNRVQTYKHGEKSASLRQVLTSFALVDGTWAVHLPRLRDHVTHKLWWRGALTAPTDLLQSYYGWEVGFYYAWMSMWTVWLTVPAVVGLVVYFLRLYRHDTIDEDEFAPFYGMVVFVWAIFFLKFWERQEKRLAVRWGTESLSPYERQKYFAVRPEFHGYERISPVTGEPETYYPNFKRRLKYVAGGIVTLAMLCVAFGVMILSININGYVNPKSAAEPDDYSHPFRVGMLASLSQPGQIFDKTSIWRQYLPLIIHVIAIRQLNTVYSTIAEALTNWENHETKLEHNNSLILKRFLFEAIDSYMSLFYLAFYERDIERLRFELLSLYQIDTFRRMLLECVIPLLFQTFTIRKRRSSTERLRPKMIPTTEEILEHIEKNEYEQFDDYLEMMIQLGYVTLFATAYPLAPFVSIAANWFEMRTDAFKLAELSPRMTVLRSSGLGRWRDVMAGIIWISALTNCLLVGFTSDQLMHYLPSFYMRDGQGHTEMRHSKSWIVVFIIFGIERLLVMLGLLIHAVVPSTPEDVADQLERQHYVRSRDHEKTLSTMSLKQD